MTRLGGACACACWQARLLAFLSIDVPRVFAEEDGRVAKALDTLARRVDSYSQVCREAILM